MKLWIRSQERDKLDLCESISIQPLITANKKHTSWCIVANFGRVGEYGTRERCLEIIDEIQKLLEMGNPPNAFMIFNDYDYLSRDEVDEILKQVRTDKAVFTSREGFSVVMPSVITYEMPEK